MTELTNLECRAVEVIVEQSDEQLRFTASQFLNSDDLFDVAEYFIVPQSRIAFPVSKNFFVMSVLLEIHFRELDL